MPAKDRNLQDRRALVTGGTKGTFSGSGATYTLVASPTAASSGTLSASPGRRAPSRMARWRASRTTSTVR